MIDVEDRLMALIADRISKHERSMQTQIGPSGLGTECPRALGFKLAEIPALAGGLPPWRQTVGTAVHTWLATMLELDNVGSGEWLIEHRTLTGRIFDKMIYGTCDVFHVPSGKLVDFKVNGPHTLKEYKAKIHKGEIPRHEYRVQGHTYGRGLEHDGYEVNAVGILFLPMNGELREAVYWEEPYDRSIADEAFARARKIQARINTDGAAVTIPKLKRVASNCGRCDWFSPSAMGDALAFSCPGADSLRPSTSPSVEDVLG